MKTWSTGNQRDAFSFIGDPCSATLVAVFIATDVDVSSKSLYDV